MKAKLIEKFRNISKNLGENNKPTYVVMAIATVKGICRPTFTMMDKKEDPKTKKYTAIREGLTEVIAIPVYWGLGELSAKVATKALPKELQKQGAKNAMFLGVCTAALFVIPGLCSAVIKPIMGHFYHDNDKDKEGDKEIAKVQKLDVTSETPKISVKPDVKNITVVNRPSLQTFAVHPEHGMKVGGV